MFVGIITHTTYGISGNELPPGSVSTVKTAEIIDVDTIKEAYGIMANKVIPLRLDAAKQYLKSQYTIVDSYTWEVIKLED